MSSTNRHRDGGGYRVYLSGPIDSPLAERWREDIRTANNFPDLTFVDPTTFEEDDEEFVNRCIAAAYAADGVIVHYEHGEDLSQVAIEMAMAAEAGDRAPVIVWLDQYKGPREEIPLVVRTYATELQMHGRQSINRVMELM